MPKLARISYPGEDNIASRRSTDLTAQERADLAEKFQNLNEADLDFLHQLSEEDRAKVAKVFDQKNKIADARGEGIKKMAENGSIDGLTKLKNRKSFDEEIKKEVARAERFEIPLTFIFSDIDHFKKVNDQFGHLAGDEVLRQFAAKLKKVSRSIDFVARYGGEEFAIILPETDLAGATVLAEKLRAAIEEMEIEFENKKIPITASFGVAQKIPGEDSGKLIGDADKNLYSAKESGRNRVVAESRDAQK